VRGRACEGGDGSSAPLSTILRNSVLEDDEERPPRVSKSASSGIDFDMLRARDQPILFFDELLMYQDDLEDCGEVIFDVKLRVMPLCWFVLSRFFLRVDGVVVRIRENRLFHKFGQDVVELNVTWKECPTSSLPITSLRDVPKLTELVPVVHEASFQITI